MKKHVKSKLFAVLLSFLMVFTLIPGMSAFAEDTPSKSTDTVSASKTAAKQEVTDDDLTTDVTLSLPAADKAVTKQKVDIVFVMDASGYADIKNIIKESESLFNTLVNSDAYDAKIGVIKFAGWGSDAIKDYAGRKNLDSDTYKNLVPLNADTKENIKNAMSLGGTNGVGGSNSEQPMRMANAMLEKYGDKDAAKYIVMLSDFSTYIWEGTARMGDKRYDHVPVGTATSQNFTGSWWRPAYTTVTVWDPNLGDWYGAKYGRPNAPVDNTYNVDNVWAHLWADYNSDERFIPGTDWGQDEIFVRKSSEGSWISYDYSGEFDNQPTIKYAKDANYAKDCEALWNSVKSVYGYGKNQKPHVGGVYRSTILTRDAFEKAAQAGTNLVIYCSTDKNVPLQNSIRYAMLKDLKAKHSDKVSIYNMEYKVDQSKSPYTVSNEEGMDVAIKGLEKQITQHLIEKGTVIDEIGDKFDLVVDGDKCPFTVKVGDAILAATRTSDNTWSFGTADKAGVYPYVATYIPASDTAKESIKWEINVPVNETQKVSLTYKVKLVDTSKSGEFDTNNSAMLDYISTDGTTGQQAFEKPKVKYTKLCKVTFMDANKKIAEVKVESGKSINSDALTDQSMPQDPTKEEFTFKGWKDGSGDAFNGDTTVNTSMIVYAQWEKNETPQPPATEGTVVASYVDENGKALLDPVTLTGKTGDAYKTEKKDIDGYTFKEMGKDSAAAEGKFTDGSLTVTYVYKQNETPQPPVVEKYTITYDPNGGNWDGSTDNRVYTDIAKDTVIKIDAAPTREGYTFQYWKGSEYQPGADYTVTGDHTFVAQWKKNETTPGGTTPGGQTPTKPIDKSKVQPSNKAILQTGDNSNMMLYGFISLGAGLALLGLTINKKRKLNEKQKQNKLTSEILVGHKALRGLFLCTKSGFFDEKIRMNEMEILSEFIKNSTIILHYTQ